MRPRLTHPPHLCKSQSVTVDKIQQISLSRSKGQPPLANRSRSRWQTRPENPFAVHSSRNCALNAEADRLEAFLNALVTHLQKRGVLIPDFDTSDIRREGNEDRLAAAAAFIADLTDMRQRFMSTIH